MTMQTVRIAFGKANLSDQNATYTVLRVRPPFMKDSAHTSGRRASGTMQTFPVSAFPRVNGAMYMDDVSHENGTILMLQSSKKRGARRIADGCVLLRLRETAALLNVTVSLPQGRENLLGASFQMFAGRADILSVDEARVHRIEISRGFVDNMFDIEEVETLYTITEIAPETTPKPESVLVSTATGLVTQEVAVAPARRLRFRK